ncbi:LysM peptidoglycan-binding domain-containing protein [Candidatus Leptofilum sp.]|uniref:LysM peptidoglycan-binding domain-containing protein n=1 Tax=Candidatus Leptofilum sp. TaxID=3241576 RepID=UPI003B5A5615
MSKAKLSSTEWDLVKDAPFWVNAALAAADGRVALIVKRKEAKAVNKAMDAYKGGNQLVRDVIANEEDPDKAVKKATQSQAEKALSRISGIVEKKLGADDLDTFNTFLLSVGRSVAEAAGEGVLGIGKNTSDEESEALQGIAAALKATPADKQARRRAKQAAEKAAREAKAREAAAAKAKAEAAAKAKAEAAAKAKAQAEAKAKAAADAKAKAEREAKLEAQKQKRDKALEARKLERAKEKAAREAEAKAKAEAEAKAKAASKSRFTEFIAEHKVVSGENLSVISEKYYNTQANWRFIYEANQDVIGDNPNLIRVGQVLKIPKL